MVTCRPSKGGKGTQVRLRHVKDLFKKVAARVSLPPLLVKTWDVRLSGLQYVVFMKDAAASHLFIMMGILLKERRDI